MAWTQADLDRLDAAIASGTKSVQLDGQQRVFQSTRDMLQVRAIIVRSLNPNQPTTTLATTRKGF